MPEDLSKLKKYVTDRMVDVKDKQSKGPQGEPATYDEGYINGELWGFEQILHQIKKIQARLQHEADCDEVACEVSYEIEPGEDALSVRVRKGVFDHIKEELLTWRYKNLNWKYDKGRKIAAEYMYDRTGGDNVR